jgi:uncharacterized protein (TIGR02284 family)
MNDTANRDPVLIAALNDLLQLDHDALQAYDVAIENLESESSRETLRQFRADHARHVAELTNLVRSNGGSPVHQPHLSTGLFKLAVQQIGRAGGDYGILLAFEANERQVRDKYWRHAERPHPPEVRDALRRNAEDEERHYSWAIETLRRMDPGSTQLGEQARHLVALAQARAADLFEGVERNVREQADRLGSEIERHRG